MTQFKLRPRQTLSAFALLCTSTQISAQDIKPVYELHDYTVSSGPVARQISDFASPISSLNREEIQQNGSATLGELLANQPGVHATSFGGGASRPIIRGFDGPRVRILDSSIEATDVSETSPDHAVTVEPLLVERVEIIRGPATLLYGSSAIGGVVNVIGKELPRERAPADGNAGGLEVRYDTVSEGHTYLGYGSIGVGDWAVNVTGLRRENNNYTIPGRSEIDEEEEPGELESSFVETDAFSIGSSWFFGERNYIGAAFSSYESLYGVPGHGHGHGGGGGGGDHHDEEMVSIDLERTRFHGELVIYEPVDWIEAARARFGYTDYKHTELEGDKTGTVFDRESCELRTEASHTEWALADEGVFGLQFNDSDFSANGDEAFAPASTTQSQAIFFSEHIHTDSLHIEYGGRLERQTVKADGSADDYEDLAFSLAGGIIWSFAEGQSLAVSLQRSQRQPNATELYAEGPHLATSQYEFGDPDLELETAYGVDLTYHFHAEKWDGTLTFFYTYFDDYIYAENLGYETDAEGNKETDPAFDDDEALDTYQFTAVDATFWGFEAEVHRMIYKSGNTRFTLGLLADYVRAENRDGNQPLPRIPPLRVGAQAKLESGAWGADLMLRQAFEQNRDAPEETETSGYTELDLNVSRDIDLGNDLQLTFFARADNLLDEDIRHHTSFVKDTAPLPGRNLTLGARFEF